MNYKRFYSVGMRKVGMRELNQYPSRVIDLVKHGETIEITERGRPVARVVPLTQDAGVLASLVRDGRALAPCAASGQIPVPPMYGSSAESAASEIAASRARERW
jgi:prevent-host-death family protein